MVRYGDYVLCIDTNSTHLFQIGEVDDMEFEEYGTASLAIVNFADGKEKIKSKYLKVIMVERH